jgi:cold shock CspA family protein
MTNASQRERGKVLSFDNAKGTGRIVSDEQGDRLFVHFAFITSQEGQFRTLSEGQLVEYSRVIQPGPHGDRPVAMDVVAVLPGPEPKT